jgi:hypothetical protein
MRPNKFFTAFLNTKPLQSGFCRKTAMPHHRSPVFAGESPRIWVNEFCYYADKYIGVCLRSFRRKTIRFMILFNIVALSPLFSQTEFENQVQKFAEELNGLLAFSSGMGLNWSDPYIGELLGYPPHIGFGVAMTGAFTNQVETANLWGMMGSPRDDSSTWFPSYVFAGRMGGPRGVPFDLGFKIGYLSEITLWGDLKYHMLLLGVDVNYALFLLDDTDTTITIGFGYDQFEGALSGTLATVPAGVVDTSGSPVASGTPAHTTWTSSTYKFQVLIGQPVLESPVSVFGGLHIGYSSNTIGVKFGDEKDPDSQTIQDLTAFSIFGHFGLSLQSAEWNYDMSIMVNFASSMDIGFNIGVRYQF